MLEIEVFFFNLINLYTKKNNNQFKKLLLKEIKSVDEKFEMTICGSFRRG
jgi:hypothetical protein